MRSIKIKLARESGTKYSKTTDEDIVSITNQIDIENKYSKLKLVEIIE